MASFNTAAAIVVEDFKGDAWELIPLKYNKGALWWFCNEVIPSYYMVPLPVFSEWWDAPRTQGTMGNQRLAA